jgi:hypothetical protein
LQEIWSLFLRLIAAPHPQTLNQWVLSDWRLHNLIRGLGFNWHRHDYTYVWQNEIELQPVNVLIRSLCEMPGKGRAPFDLPAVPTLFVWGSRDALTAKPRRPRPNDILIPANHSAPMLAAKEVAAAVLPFLTTGEISTRGQEQALSLRTSIWRSMLRKPKQRGTRRRREGRMVNRLHINRGINLHNAEKGSATSRERRLLGQRQKNMRGTTDTTKKRLFLLNSRESRTASSERRFFFRRLDRLSVSSRDKQQS